MASPSPLGACTGREERRRRPSARVCAVPAARSNLAPRTRGHAMQCSLQEIFDRHFESYAQGHALHPRERHAAWCIQHCHRPEMGSHVLACPAGHHSQVQYHACRHRSWARSRSQCNRRSPRRLGCLRSGKRCHWWHARTIRPVGWWSSTFLGKSCFQDCWARNVPKVNQASNPSIERTCPGKPGQASHLKR